MREGRAQVAISRILSSFRRDFFFFRFVKIFYSFK